MAQHVSPGVYTKIVDLSEYVQSVPSTIGFLPIISERGPDNQLILTNARDFYIDFGEPNINYGGKKWGQGMYVASSFLKNSDSLYVIRVTPDEASYSNIIFSGELEDNFGGDGTSNITVTSVANLNSEDEINAQVATEEDSTGGTAALAIIGAGRGAWYNNFKINISSHANVTKQREGVYILDIYQRQNSLEWVEDSSGNGDWVEAFGLSQTFEVSFHPDKLDDSGDSQFIADVINQYCRYIKAVANRDLCRTICEYGNVDWSEEFLTEEQGIRLENGSDGLFLGTDEEIAAANDAYKLESGDTEDKYFNATAYLARAYSGQLQKIWGKPLNSGTIAYVDEVIDTDNYYFSIVLDGGYPDAAKEAAKEMVCRTRMDCVFITDNGDNKTYTDSTNVQGSSHSYNDWHVAMYESYSKIYDIYTGRDIWITPVYHMASVIPYTDNVAELWWAPAGFNRGTLSSIKDLRFSPRIGERDEMYLRCINPIVKFNVGYTVWGQLTTQRRPSALQDLNIARLVLYIKRALEQFCKYYIFELNDSVTWGQIQSNIQKFLKVIQDKRGLYNFSVQVGATDYEIKSKQCHIYVTLNPTRIIEKINLTFFIV